jgi:transmembrane sensor
MDISQSPTPTREPGISEQAARWVAVLERDSQPERLAFVNWLRASPQHAREFLLCTALEKELSELDLREFDVEALLARAAANVRPMAGAALAPASARRDATQPALPERRVRWGLAAAATLFASGAAWWATQGPGTWQDYATVVGEQRTFELEDGSIIQLSPMSHVEVRLTEQARTVRLESGEALFKVENDVTRPFRVDTGAALIEVLGTQFAVNRRSDSVTVSVLEGRVSVDGRILGAGEEVRISDASPPVERTVTPEEVSGRLSRRSLTFSGNTLAEIAEDFNRYNRSPRIRIEGEALRRQEFSGVFDAHDPASLVSYLERDRHIEVERREGTLVIRSIAEIRRDRVE